MVMKSFLTEITWKIRIIFYDINCLNREYQNGNEINFFSKINKVNFMISFNIFTLSMSHTGEFNQFSTIRGMST